MFEMRTGEEQDPKIPNLNKRKTHGNALEYVSR